MQSVKDMLREKQQRGVKDVRVNTVLAHIEDEERDARTRMNGSDAGGGTRNRRRLDLVGTAEAADMLGVERPRIGRWKKAGVMPEPVAELRSGPVWHRSQIKGMMAEREKRRRSVAA